MSEVATKSKPKVVFQALDASVQPNQLVYVRKAHSEAGVSYRDQEIWLHMTEQGQFIVPEDCDMYDEQVAGLYKAQKRGVKIVNLADCKNRTVGGTPWDQKPDPKDELQAAKAELAARNDDIAAISRAVGSKDATISEQQEEIARLKAELQKRGNR